MKKEDLIALGLSEEQADKVIEGYGQMVPKTRLDTKINEVNDLNNQLKDRDEQLENLKKVDVSKLQETITDLQQTNDQLKTEHAQQMADRDFNDALNSALQAAKARNPLSVKGLLNLDSLKLDGDKILGLDEQLTALKASDDYLFTPEGVKGKTPPGSQQQGGKQSVTKEQFATMSIVEKTELYNKDYELYKSLTE